MLNVKKHKLHNDPRATRPARRIVTIQFLGFLLAIAACWLTELVDPPFTLTQVIIETLIILIVGILTLRDTIAASNELRRINNELIRSNQDLERFAYVVAHDLQGPLTTVSGFMALLQRRYKDKIEGKGGEYIKCAIDGADRMRHLIDDLLDYSLTGGDKKMDSVDVTGVVNTVLLNIQNSIQEAGAVVTFDTLPTVTANARELTQAFQNLIVNAIKFRREDVPPIIQVGSQEEDDRWVFSVRDNGIGIPAEEFDRIFEVFQRLHSSQQYTGTGIGLAVVKKIVEAHGGDIWVESEIGKGSTFNFSIPVKRKNTTESEPN
jgi:light-regulated signal transduction histidine kinase (bacteriophytochrome)